MKTLAYFNWEDNTWVKYTVNGFLFFHSPTKKFLFSPKKIGNKFLEIFYFFIYKCKFNYNFFYFSGKNFQILDITKRRGKKKKPDNTWVED